MQVIRRSFKCDTGIVNLEIDVGLLKYGATKKDASGKVQIVYKMLMLLG